MDKVFIAKNGMPVKLTSAFSNTQIDVNGFLTGFDFDNKSYEYLMPSDFRNSDIHKAGPPGYYYVADFLKYMQYEGSSIPTLEDIKKNVFSFERFRAQPGDEINLQIMDYGAPFNYYYKQKKVTFTLELDPQTHAAKWYTDATGDKILIPSGATSVQYNQDFNTNPRGLFYNKNLGSVINTWTIDDEYKKGYSETTTLMCFKILLIERQLFSKIIDNASMAIVNAAADRSNLNISDLTDIQQTIFILKKNWGYFYTGPTSPYPHRQNFSAILPGIPEPYSFSMYLNSLNYFYKQIFRIQDILLAKSEDERLSFLLKILPYSALDVIPVSIRLKALKDIMGHDMPDEIENFAMRIIYSFTELESDAFLDFLLKIENGTDSNFQIIYRKMDDNRLARYPFVGWFADGASNRKYFTYAVYKAWKTSKYNSSYIPPGTTPNTDNLNPAAYFISDPRGIDYFKNTETVLAYSPGPTTTFTTFGYINNAISKVVYQSDINGIVLNVDQVLKKQNSTSSRYGTSVYESEEKSKFATYHLYQPIALLHYMPDLEIEMPQTPLMPAFLFHYIEEFDRLKDMDAGYSLLINVTIEAMLFYFTGGLSTLRDLRYLKYSTEIGQAMRGVVTPIRLIEVWRGLEAGSQVIALSSSVLSSVSQYIATTSNDPATKEAAEKVSRFFLYLSLASSVGATYARVKAVNAAEDVLATIPNLPPGAPTLPQEVIDLLTTLKGAKAVSVAFFENVLNTLELDGALNRVLARYNLFTEAEKFSFWQDFAKLNNKDSYWKILNVEYTIAGSPVTYTLVDIWKDGIQYLNFSRNNIDFLASINRIKYLKYHELQHVMELHGTAGGHIAIFVSTDINDANAIYKFVPANPSYTTNIPSNLRSVVTDINTHKMYENLWRYNPNVSDILIDGLGGVSKKRWHYVLDPGWDEQRIIEEMAYAWANKKQVANPRFLPANYGRTIQQEITEYSSRFSDGTKIEFIHKNYGLDPVTNLVKDDHIALMKIVP